MGNEIVMIAIIGVGGFLAYKFLLQNKASAAAEDDTPPPANLPPPSAADMPAKEAVEPVVMKEAEKDLTQNQVVNNNFYIQDFGFKVPAVVISPVNRNLLTFFNPEKYMHDSKYRRSINILINHLPNKRERDYWDDLTDALDKRIRQKQKSKPVPKLPPVKPCIQRVACALTTHWDPHLCKCVPNVVPTPNTNRHFDGRERLVDGADSRYSRSTLVNNPGRLFY